MIVDPQDDIAFRSLSAPGLEEDDLFAAMSGIPGELLWGAGRPSAFTPPDSQGWNPRAERHRRHHEMLSRWPVVGKGP